jgi:hypothetical protein
MFQPQISSISQWQAMRNFGFEKLLLKGIVSRKFGILFWLIRNLGSLEYLTFSGEFLLSHKTVNELCYIGGFVNSIVT